MDNRAVRKAHSRLRAAKKALNDLAGCQSYDAFADVWYVLLFSAKGVYTVLEQGAKISPKSRAWFEDKARERRSDPLLQYLYEARNTDEHGIAPVLEHAPGQLNIGVMKPGFSTRFQVNGSLGLGKELEITPLDEKPLLIELTSACARLTQVHDRHGRPYDPPDSHFGQPITSQRPAAVAELWIAYLESLIQDAERLVIQP